jgi:hypothetical protein
MSCRILSVSTCFRRHATPPRGALRSSEPGGQFWAHQLAFEFSEHCLSRPTRLLVQVRLQQAPIALDVETDDFHFFHEVGLHAKMLGGGMIGLQFITVARSRCSTGAPTSKLPSPSAPNQVGGLTCRTPHQGGGGSPAEKVLAELILSAGQTSVIGSVSHAAWSLTRLIHLRFVERLASVA